MSNGISRIKVKFIVEDLLEAEGELVRFLAPRTVEALVRAMPIHGVTATMKDMVYFSTPVRMGSEKPRLQVDGGMLTYWPMASSICIFLERSQPYSPMNIIGNLGVDPSVFREVGTGRRIRMVRY
ncbi:MAG: cyclophilin-like family protein [Candidatus Bathyarchaeia archaeon]|nr:hypothetical protein [Candidatus Bathyarchaeota archaeon]